MTTPPKKHRTGPWLLASSIAFGLLVSPFAIAAGEGGALLGGQRNPGTDESKALASETEIIASNTTYGTRQSNKGEGGGAIYGCRAAVAAEPCIRAVNLVQGRAFEFATGGPEGGRINATGGDSAKPFTTNATGVATGLNADRVDSKSADDLLTDARNLTKFVAVNADGSIAGNRGSAVTSRTSEGTYNVVFADDVSTCALSATQTQFENAGAVGVQLGADKKTVTVRTRTGGGSDGTAATPPADRPFHLIAHC